MPPAQWSTLARMRTGYRELDLAIVRSIVRDRLGDFEAFTSHVIRTLARD